jgi:hypothetical protein
MEALSSRPINLVRVEFDELYARHLCRHSQLGVNVLHLLALFFVWLGVYGAVYWLVRTPWVPIGMAVAYLLAVAPSLPPRVILATAVFLALFVLTLLELPLLPIWAYLALIPVFYYFQNWSHKAYHLERDMTLFNQKYTKGRVLFVILLFYEVPLLLNFLLFGRRDWTV